jgi:hypothetical protein
MKRTMYIYAVGGALLLALAACGGGGSGASAMSSSGSSVQYGTVPLLVSDASSEDWALVGVNVLSIALIPQGGGANVPVYTAAAGGTALNLVQLDDLADILGTASVPTGSYVGAVLTVAANPGDLQLTASAEPQAGFALAAGAVVASQDIQIQGATGAAANLTVPITVNFDSPLVVSTGTNMPVDIEFDLSHPAFIIGHQPPGGQLLWAVNFKGPVRPRPISDITRLVLRHTYGNVASVAGDGSSITITKDFPTIPIVTPETAVASSQQLTILVDGTNGTLFYDVDAKTSTTITSFSTVSGLAGKYVRIAARYQENGTLIATRIWASSTFANVWISPEGHVLHVNTASNVVTVTNEQGRPVQLQINDSTQFYFRQPWSAIADGTPIGSGTAFLASGDLVRGFKVHASVADPLAAQLVAQSIDIETAAYSGTISDANTSSFTYTHDFVTTTDDYTYALDYINSMSANGTVNGTANTGFDYWNFAYPTLVTAGPAAIADFIAATSGTVSFGGNAKAITPVGVSDARWGDPADPSGWSAPWTVMEPVPVPLAAVGSGVTVNGASVSFTITVPAGTQPVTVAVSNISGQATLVYQVDRTSGILTVSPIDITTTAGMSTFTAALTTGTPVKVYGIPQADGTLKSYVIAYYTGTMPAD